VSSARKGGDRHPDQSPCGGRLEIAVAIHRRRRASQGQPETGRPAAPDAAKLPLVGMK
jgi:hypothetical protein